MLPEVEAALNYFKETNAKPNCWAAFEGLNTESGLFIRVKVGVIRHDGQKEVAFKTRIFYSAAGKADYLDLVHS